MARSGGHQRQCGNDQQKKTVQVCALSIVQNGSPSAQQQGPRLSLPVLTAVDQHGDKPAQMCCDRQRLARIFKPQPLCGQQQVAAA